MRCSASPRAVLAAVFLAAALSATAAPRSLPEGLIGTWKGGTRAVEIGHGYMKISGKDILFSTDGVEWECATRYTVIESAALSHTVSRRFDRPAQPDRYVKLRLDNRSACSEATELFLGYWNTLPGVMAWTEGGAKGATRRRGHFHRTEPFSPEGVPMAGIFEAASTMGDAGTPKRFGQATRPLETPQLPQSDLPPPRSWGSGDVEVILVSGYQPLTPLTEVEIDRPGRNVVLVLTSYDKVLWQVKVGQGTTLRGVLLGSNDRQAGVIGDASIAVHRVPLPYVDRVNHLHFRETVELLNRWLGTDKVHAFRGSGTLPGRVLVRSLDEPREELSVEGIRPVTPATVFEFELLGTDLQPVLHRNTGPVAASAAPPPRSPAAQPVAPVLLSALHAVSAVAGREADQVWLLDSSGLKRRNRRTGETVPIALPASFPSLSWPTAVAYDRHQDIVTLITLGGEGFLYRYDAAKGRWLDHRSLNEIDLNALAYDPVARRYLAWSADGELLSISPAGELQWNRPLVDRLHGFGSLYNVGNARPPSLFLAPRGRHVALVYQDGLGTSHIWTYDEVKGTVQLTYRRPAR